MSCCGEKMELLFNDNRGRWEKEVYQCPKCGEKQIKRVRLIPNKIGRW